MEYHHKVRFYPWILYARGERSSKMPYPSVYLLRIRKTWAREAQQESLFNLSFRHFNQSSSGVQETWWNACYVEAFFSRGFFIFIIHTVSARKDTYKYLYNTVIKWYTQLQFHKNVSVILKNLITVCLKPKTVLDKRFAIWALESLEGLCFPIRNIEG